MASHFEKLQRITDLISGYQKVNGLKKVQKKINTGKCLKLKRINLIRGRYYYPAKVHRTSKSNIIVIKNTAMNTFQTLEEATDEAIYNRMFAARQREKLIKANAFVSNIMGMVGGSYQKALKKHGLTNSDDMFEYNEEDDDDYEPSESDGSDDEEQQDEDDDEEFEEQEQEDDDGEEQEDDDEDDEENEKDEGFEFEDSDE